MAQTSEPESKDKGINAQKKEGFLQYFQWINEDWLALFIGLLIVILALLGLLDWVTW